MLSWSSSWEVNSQSSYRVWRSHQRPTFAQRVPGPPLTVRDYVRARQPFKLVRQSQQTKTDHVNSVQHSNLVIISRRPTINCTLNQKKTPESRVVEFYSNTMISVPLSAVEVYCTVRYPGKLPFCTPLYFESRTKCILVKF